ncbi:MAG: response regulator [Gammaproteobacteria bacterium]
MKTLTTGEAAALCGVNFRTVIRWIEKGLLVAHRLPGRGDHRIQVDDFIHFLEENKIPIPEPLLETSRQTVLVIDDEPEVARAYFRTLKRVGLEVVIANDGFNAGVKLLTLKPALVILDLKMPNVDGFQVLQFIRSESALKGVKVLVASGQSHEVLAQALEAGANAVLAKPFTNQALLDEVSRLMRIKLVTSATALEE